MTPPLHKLRRELLDKSKGIVTDIKPSVPKDRRYKRYTGKTPAMKLLELKYGQFIEELLRADIPGYELAEKFDVHEGTISKWRQRLGIVSDYTVEKQKLSAKKKEVTND